MAGAFLEEIPFFSHEVNLPVEFSKGKQNNRGMNRKAPFNWTALLLLPVLLATNWLSVAHHHRHCGNAGCGEHHATVSPAATCSCEIHRTQSHQPLADLKLDAVSEGSSIAGSAHCLICSLLSTLVSTPIAVFDWSPVAAVESTATASKVSFIRQFSGSYRSRAPPANS